MLAVVIATTFVHQSYATLKNPKSYSQQDEVESNLDISEADNGIHFTAGNNEIIFGENEAFVEEPNTEEIDDFDEMFQSYVDKSQLPTLDSEARLHYVSIPDPKISLSRFVNHFDIIVVVNTAETGAKEFRQRGYFYKKIQKQDQSFGYQLVTPGELLGKGVSKEKGFSVASGKDEYHTVMSQGKPVQIKTYRNGKEVYKTAKTPSTTEPGYFPINSISRSSKKSSAYDVPLPSWMLFNDYEGQGGHRGIVYGNRRLSHGCVRIKAPFDRLVFNQVEKTADVIPLQDTGKGLYLNSVHGTFQEFSTVTDPTLTFPNTDIPLMKLEELRQNRKYRKYWFDNYRYFHRVTKYRTMFIINSAPDIDYSKLADENQPENIPPNAG